MKDPHKGKRNSTAAVAGTSRCLLASHREQQPDGRVDHSEGEAEAPQLGAAVKGTRVGTPRRLHDRLSIPTAPGQLPLGAAATSVIR